MDAEYETSSYLKYLNDSETPNSYLLSSNEVGLNDSFSVEPIFTEIETTDWPSEGLSVLLSSPLISEENAESSPVVEDINFLKGDIHKSVEANESEDDPEEIQVQNSEESCVDPKNGNVVGYLNFTDNNQSTEQEEVSKTYINYSPIVKENANGNKEIYLTEKDINNDASVIQLLNTDGSIITIDKSILTSLQFPSQEAVRNFNEYFTTVTANKCKLCNFLCETLENMKKHLIEKHPQLFTTGNKPEVLNARHNGMVSVLSKNLITENSTNKVVNNNVNSNDVKKEYTIFVCGICEDVVYSNKEEIRQHMITNHKLTNSESAQPNTTATPDSSVENKKSSQNSFKFSLLIKKQQNALKKVKCTVAGCTLKFAKQEMKDDHERCHVGENRKQFKCLRCDEKFSIWRVCSNHLWKEHQIDLGLISCPICNNFKSNSPGRVLNHMAIHNKEKPFLCALCGKGFKQLSQLKNHEAIHKAPEDMPSWSTMKKCEICDRYFANSKSLKKHIQSVHEHFKPFICNICGHKTSRKAMLELHLRQHTGAKPHTCSYCDYRTGDHNCLRKHIMKHVGAHKYKCPHCNYTCIQTSSLKNHITNKHPGQSGTYNCKYCAYTSINAAAHSAHEKCHENTIKENGKDEPSFEGVTIKTAVHTFLKTTDVEDEEETQNCFLLTEQSMEDTVDTGGITIPAGFEMQLVS